MTGWSEILGTWLKCVFYLKYYDFFKIFKAKMSYGDTKIDKIFMLIFKG